MESGAIADHQLSASASGYQKTPEYGRLNTVRGLGSWCGPNIDDYLQIDLSKDEEVTAVCILAEPALSKSAPSDGSSVRFLILLFFLDCCPAS